MNIQDFPPKCFSLAIIRIDQYRVQFGQVFASSVCWQGVTQFITRDIINYTVFRTLANVIQQNCASGTATLRIFWPFLNLGTYQLLSDWKHLRMPLEQYFELIMLQMFSCYVPPFHLHWCRLVYKFHQSWWKTVWTSDYSSALVSLNALLCLWYHCMPKRGPLDKCCKKNSYC